MASASEQSRPLHVLMAVPEGEQHPITTNSRVQQDLVSRRAAAYKINTNPTSIWANVKDVERSLIRCCELPEDMSEDALSGPKPLSAGRTGCGYFPLLGGGALDKGMELRFLGIIAKDCRTLSSRSLALAILERTLEMHLIETEEAREQLERRQLETGIVEAQEEVAGDDDIDEDHDDSDAKPGQGRRSERLSKSVPKYKRTKRKRNEEESTYPVKEKRKSDYERWGRLEQFLAGGGLKVLKRWLEEGLEDEIVAKKPSNELTIQTSSTRALILPICRFLESIPFDKSLVVESKINKQIRQIEKKIDSFLKAQAKGEHQPDDLTGWTTEPTTTETDGLQAVKEAVKNLKKAWQENAKQNGDGFADPFQDLMGVLQDRLVAVSQYEAGQGPRPEWFENLEEETRKPKKSRVQLAAKERQMEVMIDNERTAARRKELEEARKKHSEYVQKLREKMQANSAAIEKKATGRRIKWKDGMISKEHRDRKTLEEVFVFNNLTPANKDLHEIVDEKQPSTTMPTNDTLESEEQAGEDMDTDEMIDLTLD